ncbi:hypothetical protein PHYBLDRAFT_171438 [Phycomyces blakesleeanus NRRL 1555(-)]|uniref:Uncharacterized protein n=1 Tax=Phycomyces blakesleeanus (strain ATCC 8743b / DSM 1359 / FGSC 10004 / NBRC 33097 / NRRL 1555) TaxID=763407 RepID=A0A162TSJ5_PHYB8|nr:hypothetical protein PHYBLDRAFT_171438 [Phycomyces blakesleeanus NRRL 1555(-)]OAD70692.1 hypothetical protein PHYBLDRAFT_171438 [Phycomyces blakesleeanus NRRL 1555(-)]|eukprot:XP_018288732.1 hypothetical protein PHYBLDRAFT_171438 [Phycomyces blakesleeanus NRRL 1555(-)]
MYGTTFVMCLVYYTSTKRNIIRKEEVSQITKGLRSKKQYLTCTSKFYTVLRILALERNPSNIENSESHKKKQKQKPLKELKLDEYQNLKANERKYANSSKIT